MELQKWICTQSLCSTQGAEAVATYGVRVEHPGGLWEWADVHVDSAAVQRLVDRLNRMQPEPCHFADIVQDYIAECGMMDL